jgi:hypothetical protein
VCRTGFIGCVVLDKFIHEDAAHGGLLFKGGTLPVEPESLAADAALDVLSVFGLSE